MERGKLVVARGDELHEILAHHVGILALEGAFHIGVDYALGGDLVAHIMINQLGVVLRAHAGERLALRLRDAQTLKGVLDVLRHVRPVVLHLRVRADIGGDVVNVQPLERGAPVGQAQLVVDLERLQAELLHPHGVALFLGQLVHDLRRQTGLHAVGVVLRVAYVVNAAVYVRNVGFFSVLCHADVTALLGFQAAEALFVDGLD